MSYKNFKPIIISVISLLFLLVTVSYAQTDMVIDIDVAPNVLNLQNNAQVVTVHTDIAYGLVVGSTVYLNGVEISSWKSDDRGYFVAKFNIDDIKSLDLCIGQYNTLTLVGNTYAGEEFSGSQDILIVNKSGRIK